MMIEPSTLLAKAGHRRRVEQRQQTLFLIWDGTCICLEPGAFACLNRLLASGVLELELTRLYEGDYCLEQHRIGHFKLYLESCCLALSLLDFLSLVQLVRLAYRRLSGEDRLIIPPIFNRLKDHKKIALRERLTD